MASRRQYKQEAFEALNQLGVENPADVEAVRLHAKASSLFGEAVKYEQDSERKNSHATALYRASKQKAESALSAAEIDKGNYNSSIRVLNGDRDS